jgi:hypothetical protein
VAEGWAEPALGDGDHDQGDEETSQEGLQYRRISRSRWAGVLPCSADVGWAGRPPRQADACLAWAAAVLAGGGAAAQLPLELNPVGPLWASLKGTGLANLAGDTPEEIIAATERGIQRIRATPHLPFSVPAPLRTVPMVRTTSLEPATFVGLAHAGSL